MTDTLHAEKGEPPTDSISESDVRGHAAEANLPRLYSCADYGWPALSHHAVMSVASDLGYDGIDIGIFGETTHVRVTDLADWRSTARSVGRGLEAHDLRCGDVFLTPSMDLSVLDPANPHNHNQERSLEIFAQALQFASAVGSEGLTMTPGVVHGDEEHSAALERAIRGLRRRVDIAAGHGLQLSVEPHWGSIVDTVERIRCLLAEVEGLTLTLDVSMMFFSGISIDEIASLAGSARHVQLRAGTAERLQVRSAENAIDFEVVIASLKACGYRGFVATEYVWTEKWGCDRVDVTEESARLLAGLKQSALGPL